MIDAAPAAFSRTEPPHCFVHCGLPPFSFAEPKPQHDFQKRMARYWMRDVQDLFRLHPPSSFRRFGELLLAPSGAHFDATRFAAPCGVSRMILTNRLAVL